MKALKRTAAFFLVLSLMVLAACSSGGEVSNSSNSGDSSNNSDASSGGSNESKTLRLAYIMAEGGPAHEGAKKFKEIVEEKTGGALKVVLAPNAQLGGERDVMEGLKLGSVEMALTGDGPIGMFAPQYAALQLPFAVRDVDHLDKVYNGEVGQGLADQILKGTGARVLDWWHRGPRRLTANLKVESPEDIQGVKMRVPEVPLFTTYWTEVGASPTPIPFAELYSSLEQGIVDAQENPLELIYTSHFDEVQDYIMNTNHFYGPYILSISDRIWGDLTPEQQDIVQSAAKEAGKLEKKLTADGEKEFEKLLKDAGVEFVDVDRKAFQEIANKVAEQMKDDWKEGLYEQIVNTK